MQINVVMTRESLKTSINQFLEENHLIFFYEDATRKLQISTHIVDDMFNTRDFMIYIGNEQVYNDRILSLDRRPTSTDKIDFIYLYAELYPNEIKITDTVFSWNTKSASAGKNGKLLKAFFDKKFHKGMQSADERYSSLNKSLLQYYWSDDIARFNDKIFNTGGVVKITPMSK
ncbi:hypothetical protein FHW36_10713 [Chitinophaga polysaccharea]|uniref:Uncharacterized protein n=1 Tax=Chitinophaga polysaccharea TaxID=1293035 RepID=A0A561PG46_9BACT|nr:hypothetical protein [Chitinophaga polysaccharea]TWF37087.1 hypothetical protein FHW36_10713 [Chitinophaga polysaccharea]